MVGRGGGGLLWGGLAEDAAAAGRSVGGCWAGDGSSDDWAPAGGSFDCRSSVEASAGGGVFADACSEGGIERGDLAWGDSSWDGSAPDKRGRDDSLVVEDARSFLRDVSIPTISAITCIRSLPVFSPVAARTPDTARRFPRTAKLRTETCGQNRFSHLNSCFNSTLLLPKSATLVLGMLFSL